MILRAERNLGPHSLVPRVGKPWTAAALQLGHGSSCPHPEPTSFCSLCCPLQFRSFVSDLQKGADASLPALGFPWFPALLSSIHNSVHQVSCPCHILMSGRTPSPPLEAFLPLCPLTRRHPPEQEGRMLQPDSTRPPDWWVEAPGVPSSGTESLSA
jgi:hypothetical protein